MRKLHKKITVTAGGGNIVLKTDDLNSYYHVVGSDVTLSTGLVFTSDNAIQGHVITIYWTQKVTRDSNTITVLGTVLDLRETENLVITAIYDGSAWIVFTRSKILNSSGDEGYVQISDGFGGFTSSPNFTYDLTTKSLRIGDSNTVTGDDSNAFGSGNTVSGDESTAFGNSNIVSGNESVAGGSGNTSSGLFSTSFGVANTASSVASFAWGNINTASGSTSTTWGKKNTASGVLSTVWGDNNTAATYLETVLGNFSTEISGNATSWAADDPLFRIGNGTSIGDRADALTVYKNGKMKLQNVLQLTPLATLPPTGQMGEMVVLTDGTLWLYTTEWKEVQLVDESESASASLTP